MELTYLQRLKLLNEINESIQVQEIQFKNAEPFYHVAAELQKFLELLPIKGCCKEFDEHVEKKCTDYIKEMIEESKKDLPKDHSREPEKTIYLKHTMKQLKQSPVNCLGYIKTGYEKFCLAKMVK